MITGKARITRKAVTNVIQVNSGILIKVIPGARMLIMVTIKLKAEASDAIPRTCRLNIQKSTPSPGLNCSPLNGA